MYARLSIFVLALLCIVAIGAPDAQAGDPVPMPVIVDHAAGEGLDLGFDLKMELRVSTANEEMNAPAALGFDCAIVQGPHVLRASAGGVVCELEGAQIVKAGFTYGPAKLQATTTFKGKLSGVASIDFTFEDARTNLTQQKGGGLGLFRCLETMSVSIANQRLSFRLRITNPFPGPTQSEVLDAGRLSVALKADGTFNETVRLPAGIFQQVNLPTGPTDDADALGQITALKKSGAVSVHGTMLGSGDGVEVITEIVADPSLKLSDRSSCDNTYRSQGWHQAGAGVKARDVGKACSTSRDCILTCFNGHCQ